MTKKILCVFPYGIGDNLLAGPALRAARPREPGACFGWACPRRVRASDVVKLCPEIDEIVPTRDPRTDYGDSSFEEAMREHFADWEKKGERLGYREFRPIIIQERAGTHRMDSIAEAFGVALQDRELRLYPTPNDRRKAELWLNRHGLDDGRPYLVFHSGPDGKNGSLSEEDARSFLDCLPDRLFVRLRETRAKKTAPQPSKKNTVTLDKLDSRSAAFVGEIMARSKGFVGVASGPMWIAQAAGSPALGLCLNGDPEIRGPLRGWSLDSNFNLSASGMETPSGPVKEDAVRLLKDARFPAEALAAAVRTIFL